MRQPTAHAMAVGRENASMRLTSIVIVFTILIAAVLMVMQPAAALEPYCPNPAHAKPGNVPGDLIGAVARTFQIDNYSARKVAFVRCVGQKLMGCYIGVNLDCFKAEKSRALPGATAWCREHPGSRIIPMSATGHDTIYEWSCNGRRAVAGPAMRTVDPHGYIADNWKEIH